MKQEQFRNLALELPQAEEGAHMNHPDFRVGGKIFATLWPDQDWGMVKLTPEQQAEFIRLAPDIFQPIAGGWGRRGATRVDIGKARVAPLRRALMTAWRNTAPKRLLAEFDSQ